jgi:hypothetical protein
MPSDQGRRPPQHHLRGFLARSLHRTKSRSSEHLESEGLEEPKLNKRVLSFRDLTASTGFDSVIAEFNKFKKSENSTPVQQSHTSKQRKSCVDDTGPFSTTKSTMSVAVMSSNTQTSVLPTVDGDPDMLDQALSNIRLKLVNHYSRPGIALGGLIYSTYGSVVVSNVLGILKTF